MRSGLHWLFHNLTSRARSGNSLVAIQDGLNPRNLSLSTSSPYTMCRLFQSLASALHHVNGGCKVPALSKPATIQANRINFFGQTLCMEKKPFF